MLLTGHDVKLFNSPISYSSLLLSELSFAVLVVVVWQSLLCSIVLFPSIIRAWTPSFANLSPCLVCFDKGANKGSQVYRCTDRVAFELMMIVYDIAAELKVGITKDSTGRRRSFRSLNKGLSDNVIKR
jgi:hypothetical protein